MALSHALVGCCAQAVQGAACCDVATVECDSHHAHGLSHEDEFPPLPGHNRQCCRVKCQWLAPDVIGNLVQDSLWSPMTFGDDQFSSLGNSITSLNIDAPAATLFALPVRSHLAIGVLLI